MQSYQQLPFDVPRSYTARYNNREMDTIPHKPASNTTMWQFAQTMASCRGRAAVDNGQPSCRGQWLAAGGKGRAAASLGQHFMTHHHDASYGAPLYLDRISDGHRSSGAPGLAQHWHSLLSMQLQRRLKKYPDAASCGTPCNGTSWQQRVHQA